MSSRYDGSRYNGAGYENLFRGRRTGAKNPRYEKYEQDIAEEDEHHFEDSGTSGWRISDRLYELSLEAEEQEKRQKRLLSDRSDALHEAKRENARLRAQLEEAREEAAAAAEVAASARDDARDREDDFATEVVVLRGALAQAKRKLLKASVQRAEDDDPDADTDTDDDTDDNNIFAETSLDDLAASGQEEGVRDYLSAARGDRSTLLREKYAKTLDEAMLKAAEHAHLGVCKLLLRRGAMRTDRLVREANGYTALHCAAAAGAVDIIELLCATEAYTPQSTQRSDPLDLGDCEGKTALMVAAEHGHWAVARTLLRLGADAELRTPLHYGGKSARDFGSGSSALESVSERFWNASAAGNRAWRRKHYSAALSHFGVALVLAEQLQHESHRQKDDDDSAAPSGVDLARLELNCAKAALRLGRAAEAEARASKALERHRQATHGGVYANAMAVRAECRESLYDFENAASDFEALAKLCAPNDAKAWNERARTARDHGDASHYAILGVSTRADDAELRRAYKRASMRWHPDRRRTVQSSNNNTQLSEQQADDFFSPTDDAARAERQFRRINEAKEVLLDSYKRAVYDVEQRRRLAFEADKLPSSSGHTNSDAVLSAWPWHLDSNTNTNNGSSIIKTSATSNKENYNSTSLRYATPWTKQTSIKVKSSAHQPTSGTNTDRRFIGLKRNSSDTSAGPPPPPPPPPPLERPDNQDKDEEKPRPPMMPPPAPPPEEPPSTGGEDPGPNSEGEHEWSWRLRRYENELRRQREELERARLVREKVARDRQQLADSRGNFFARRDDDDNNANQHLDLDSEDDDLDDDSKGSLEEEDDDEEENDHEDDDDTFYDGERDENDLSAQLRDASEWFDQFDLHAKGELDMTYFDKLIHHLGLREVLGEEELQRQRFFADPTGSGTLKRGSFLGWFAALLEGSAKAGMHHRSRPPPSSAFAGAWKHGTPEAMRTAVPTTAAASH